MPMVRWRQRQENAWEAHGLTSPAYVMNNKTLPKTRWRMSADTQDCPLTSTHVSWHLTPCFIPLRDTYTMHTGTYINGFLKYTLFAIRKEIIWVTDTGKCHDIQSEQMQPINEVCFS